MISITTWLNLYKSEMFPFDIFTQLTGGNRVFNAVYLCCFNVSNLSLIFAIFGMKNLRL